MAHYRGLTWDHPRGRLALERSAAATSVPLPGDGGSSLAAEPLIEWDVHPLEGFESASIESLAECYDVIVLDHPHLGDALATGSLRPMNSLFGPAWLAGVEAASIGPSLTSYRLGGSLWALPLDAATQVSVRQPSTVDAAPDTWAEVDTLSRRARVALSLAGPHAFLSFASLCVALGSDAGPGSAELPADTPVAGVPYVSREVGLQALEVLTALAARRPSGTEALNPIGLLERMRADRDIDYIPLVYGYVNYSAGAGAASAPLAFGDAPSWLPGGRRGSTIGGTGLAVSARVQPSGSPFAALLDYLRWLMNPVTQAGYIPDNAGQPSARAAWTNNSVNAAAGGFYRDTLQTLEGSWVRPRVAGFTPFQSQASAILRGAILGETTASAALDALNTEWWALAAPGTAEPETIAPDTVVPAAAATSSAPYAGGH